MKATRETRREARRLFRLCLANGLLDEDRVRRVLGRISRARSRNRLALLSHFRRRVRLAAAQHSATVESAVPLPADLQGRIQAGLSQMYGPGLATAFAPAPALIGGMRIQVGSDVYDGSIRARLATLEAAL